MDLATDESDNRMPEDLSGFDFSSFVACFHIRVPLGSLPKAVGSQRGVTAPKWFRASGFRARCISGCGESASTNTRCSGKLLEGFQGFSVGRTVLYRDDSTPPPHDPKDSGCKGEHP